VVVVPPVAIACPIKFEREKLRVDALAVLVRDKDVIAHGRRFRQGKDGLIVLDFEKRVQLEL
jgi:hypothetical protein